MKNYKSALLELIESLNESQIKYLLILANKLFGGT